MDFADDQLAAYVSALRTDPPPRARDLGPEGLRAASAARSAARPPGPEVAHVEDTTIGSLPIRLYRATTEERPLVVWVHGGGWVLGDLGSHDRVCRRLALTADVDVLALDYRRAPEHHYPAAVQDTVLALRWAREHAPAVGVGGDSAGGTVATLACQALRAAGDPQPVVQVLAYPHTDLTLSFPSIKAKGTGWGLEADAAAWFVEQWLGTTDRRLASPLYQPDLAGLAPTILVTPEHDPLHDEGLAYGAALKAAGVPVTLRTEPGMIHGFLTLDHVSPAAEAAGDRLFRDVAAAT